MELDKEKFEEAVKVLKSEQMEIPRVIPLPRPTAEWYSKILVEEGCDGRFS